MTRIAIALSVLLLAHAASDAHYNMLLPDKPWAEKGEKVTFTYQFGHPFEHELFDAPKPRTVIVLMPDGTTKKIEKIVKIALKGGDGKKVTGYNFVYEPSMRGDHTVILQTPPIWMEEAKEFVQDTAKVVLHVQAQKNWDAELPEKLIPDALFIMTPITRPYGLLPGMVFQGYAGMRSTIGGKGSRAEGNLIEIERYNPLPVKNPPPDELITFKTKTIENGIFTFAFPDPGWWCMTAGWHYLGRKWEEGGKKGPLRDRTTLWIHVDEKK